MGRNLSCKYLDRALMLTPGGEVRPCCRFDSTELMSPLTWPSGRDLEEYVGTLEFSEWNDMAKEGRELPPCHKCYREEAMGLKSMRQKPFPWLSMKTEDKGSEGFVEFLELSAGRTCNLKCRSCTALYSTKWDSDAREIGMFVPGGLSDLPLHQIPMSMLQGLRGLKITGGEPLLNPQLLVFLKSLVQSGVSKNLNVQFYTNGTIAPKEELFQLIQAFSSWTTLISLDAIGEKNTYLRHPANWPSMVPIIDQWQSSGCNMTFAVTVSSYNILSLFELLDWIRGFSRRAFEQLILQPVLEPKWMSVAELPMSIKMELEDIFQKQFTKFTLNEELPDQLLPRLERITKMFSKDVDTDQYLTEFFLQSSQLDRLRKESFAQVFPRVCEVLVGSKEVSI